MKNKLRKNNQSQKKTAKFEQIMIKIQAQQTPNYIPSISFFAFVRI